MLQVFEAEQSFLIHHANAFDSGNAEIEVWSSGWGPEALGRLASGAGMLGSWKVVLEGDFTGIPFTALWRHRWAMSKMVEVLTIAYVLAWQLHDYFHDLARNTYTSCGQMVLQRWRVFAGIP